MISIKPFMEVCGVTGKLIPPEDAGLCNNAEGCDNCRHNEGEDVKLHDSVTIISAREYLRAIEPKLSVDEIALIDMVLDYTYLSGQQDGIKQAQVLL